jgi:hypothetical protein
LRLDDDRLAGNKIDHPAAKLFYHAGSGGIAGAHRSPPERQRDPVKVRIEPDAQRMPQTPYSLNQPISESHHSIFRFLYFSTD